METLSLEISFGNSWISLRETGYRDFATQNSFAERFPSETPGFHFVKLAIEILLRKTLSLEISFGNSWISLRETSY